MDNSPRFSVLLESAIDFKSAFDADISRYLSTLNSKLNALSIDPDSLGTTSETKRNCHDKFFAAKSRIVDSMKEMFDEIEKNWIENIAWMKRKFTENIKEFLAYTRLVDWLPVTSGSSRAGLSLLLPKDEKVEKNEKEMEVEGNCFAPTTTRKERLGALFHVISNYGGLKEVQSLIDRGVDLEGRDSEGFTPLMQAACYNDDRIMDLLLRCGADAHSQDPHQRTALHFSASNGWIESVKLLLEYKVDLNGGDSKGWTPLLYAAYFRYKKCLHFLLRCKADVHCQDHSKKTVLHYVAGNGWNNTLQLLKKFKMNYNAQDSDGNTPLHWAVKSNRRKTIAPLLKAGADWNVQNKEGESSLYLLFKKRFIMGIIRQGIGQGAYVGSSGYEKLLNLELFKDVFLRDVGLCTRAVLNDFNSRRLAAVYGAVERGLLPPVGKMKVELDGWVAQEVTRAVSAEVEAKGRCDLLQTRPMVLKMMCIRSFSDYIDDRKEERVI